MGWPVVVVARGGIPVTEAPTGFGRPLSIAANGVGTAVTVVDRGGLPVTGSGGGGGGAPGPAVALFTQAPPLAGSDANVRTCFKIICTTVETMLDEFRVVIQPGALLAVPNAGAGEWAGDPSFPDTKAPIIETKFGGASGFAATSAPQTSDWTASGPLKGRPAGTKVLVSYQTGNVDEAAPALVGGSTNSTGFYQSDDSGTFWGLQTTASLGFNQIANTNYGVAKIDTRTSGGGAGPGPDPGPTNTIPMSFTDPMFAGMTELTSPITLTVGQSIDHYSIDEHSGTETLSCTDDNTVSYCRIFSRECVRITASADFDHCYLEALGIVTVPPDHADTVQHYSPGERDAVVTWKYCHFVGHLTEATATYFISDNWDGSTSFENCIFNSGPFGLKIHADDGCHLDLSFKDCFLVGPWENEYGDVPYVFARFGTGTMTFVKWENVRFATIVDGELVPGATIPQPIPE